MEQVNADLQAHAAAASAAPAGATVTTATPGGGLVKSGPPGTKDGELSLQAAAAAALSNGVGAAPGDVEEPEEARRLRALVACRVLDTPPERRFDTICTLLQSIFQASLRGRRQAGRQATPAVCMDAAAAGSRCMA